MLVWLIIAALAVALGFYSVKKIHETFFKKDGDVEFDS